MVSRICGILGGCLISLFLSVLIFPTSASQKATNGLSEGLDALTSLSRMAWGQEGNSAQAFMASVRFVMFVSELHDTAESRCSMFKSFTCSVLMGT